MQTLASSAVGIGLRAPHYADILSDKPAIDWLEVHSENYFQRNSIAHFYLERIAEHYPISMHGVGLSLGSSDKISAAHLAQIKTLVAKFQPALLSEHLSWSSVDGHFFNDLLPIPYTEESLRHFAEKVDTVQQALGQQLLIENPSAYLAFSDSSISEWAFLRRLQEQTNCGLLLDLNNIYVNAFNHGFDTGEYLENIPFKHVKEIHLAGFTQNTYPEGSLLIDTHGTAVSEDVWNLYAAVKPQCNAPTLIEWDTDIPSLSVLLEERDKAKNAQANHRSLIT